MTKEGYLRPKDWRTFTAFIQPQSLPVCAQCGFRGHRAKPGQSGCKRLKCDSCGRIGHARMFCDAACERCAHHPGPAGGGAAAEELHSPRECPFPECLFCAKVGHYADECPDAPPGMYCIEPSKAAADSLQQQQQQSGGRGAAQPPAPPRQQQQQQQQPAGRQLPPNLTRQQATERLVGMLFDSGPFAELASQFLDPAEQERLGAAAEAAYPDLIVAIDRKDPRRFMQLLEQHGKAGDGRAAEQQQQEQERPQSGGSSGGGRGAPSQQPPAAEPASASGDLGWGDGGSDDGGQAWSAPPPQQQQRGRSRLGPEPPAGPAAPQPPGSHPPAAAALQQQHFAPPPPQPFQGPSPEAVMGILLAENLAIMAPHQSQELQQQFAAGAAMSVREKLTATMVTLGQHHDLDALVRQKTAVMAARSAPPQQPFGAPLLVPHLARGGSGAPAAGAPLLPPHFAGAVQQAAAADEEEEEEEEEAEDDEEFMALMGMEGDQQAPPPAAPKPPSSPPKLSWAAAAAAEAAGAAAAAAAAAAQPAAQAVDVGTAGLANATGEYNCFLNVVIQCLWSCRDFSTRLTRDLPPGVGDAFPVVGALRELFRDLGAAEEEWGQSGTRCVGVGAAAGRLSGFCVLLAVLGCLSVLSGPLLHQPTTPTDPTDPTTPTDRPPPPRRVVNPTGLREALDAQSHRNFKIREMNDAAELMQTLFEEVCWRGGHRGRQIWLLACAWHWQPACVSSTDTHHQRSQTLSTPNPTRSASPSSAPSPSRPRATPARAAPWWTTSLARSSPRRSSAPRVAARPTRWWGAASTPTRTAWRSCGWSARSRRG
jgi:hypothetical protein